MAEEFKIIAKIVTDDKEAKVKAQTTGKEIAKSVDSGSKNIKIGDNINKSLDSVKKNTFADAIKGKLQDVKRGIQAIGVGGDRLTKLGDFFQGGAIAAFAAAALAAGAALKKMWDDAHESAEQYYERMQKNQEFLDKAIEKAQTENQATSEWFNRLHEINQLEKISNAQKAEAAILIENLTRRYGQLGITVDGTTGRYENLYEAQLKVLDLQYQAELRLRQQKRDSYTGTGGTAHVSAASVMRLLGDKTTYNQLGYVTDQGVVNTEAYGGNFNNALNMGLDVKLNTNSRRRTSVVSGITRYYNLPLDREQAEYNRKWNQGGYDGKLQWIDYMLQKHAGNQEVQNALRQLQRQILEAKMASEQYSAYRATGRPSEQRALQEIAAQNRRIQQEEASGEDAVRQGAERRRIQQQQAEYQALNTAGKIQWQERKNTEAKTEIERAEAEVARLQAEYQQSDKALAEIIQSGDRARIETAQREHLARLQNLNAERLKLQEARNAELNSRLEIQRLREQLARQRASSSGASSASSSGASSSGASSSGASGASSASALPPLTTEQIEAAEAALAELQTKTDAESVRREAELRRRIAAYYSSTIGQQRFQIQYQTLLNEGKAEEARQLKIIYDLKKGGIKYDAALVAEILQNEQRLQQIKAEAQRVEAEAERQRAEAEAAEAAEAERQRAEIQWAEAEAQRLDAEIERKAKYYREQRQQLQFELRYQKLLLQGKNEEAERLRIINDLRKQGIEIDAEKINQQVLLIQRLNDLRNKQDLVSMGQGLISQHGSSQERFLQEYKKLTQGITDEGLKADYWRLLKLREKLQNLPNIEAYQMQSNELTRRGGFRTAYIDNADKINRQIANNTKQTNEYLQQIKQITQRNGRY